MFHYHHEHEYKYDQYEYEYEHDCDYDYDDVKSYQPFCLITKNKDRFAPPLPPLHYIV